MPINNSLLGRFGSIIIPTAPQSLVAIFLSVLILSLGQSQAVLEKLGISQIVHLGTSQFQFRFDSILRSPIASQLALVAFWAAIGLFTYLICWSAYNVMVDARNRLTITTGYTNQNDATGNHWRGILETLALKAAAAAGLALILGSLWYGFSFWTTLASIAVSQPTTATIAAAVGGVIGFAAQLYLLLASVQLTFTPWYRADTFTGA